MCHVSLGLKVVKMGARDFKYNKVPLFARKNREYQYFNVCCFKTSSCASKPLLLRCKLFKSQSICQVSLGLKEVMMEANDFQYNKVSFFARKTGNINTSMSAAPKVVLVPATRYYCDVNCPYHNVCAKFH